MHSGDWIKSEKLTRAGFRHAFFTRLGGVSDGPFASLNLSTEVGDEPDHVAENLRRAAGVLGLPPRDICAPAQVHGQRVVELGSGSTGESTAGLKADALVCDRPDLACAVRTADCVPLLLADPKLGRVAAIHAGWRGVAACIAEATVATLVSRGSRAENLLVAIGPHISVRCFEVGSEVAQELVAASPAGRRAVVERTGEGKPHVNLERILIAQLERARLRRRNIESVTRCTFLDPKTFYSFRRDGSASGRHLSAIVARGQGSLPAEGESREP